MKPVKLWLVLLQSQNNTLPKPQKKLLTQTAIQQFFITKPSLEKSLASNAWKKNAQSHKMTVC